MGGYGSGRQSHRRVIEDRKKIDVLWMKRQNCLDAGNAGSLYWSINGEQVGSIQYRSHEHYLQLIYKVSRYQEEAQDIDMKVPLEWVECRFGGRRPYFICPNRRCQKRVQFLYDGFPYFLCRHCLELAYHSQRQTDDDRAASQADKIRKKVGAEQGILNGPVWQKPKGMHWKTFRRLQEKEAHYSDKALRLMAQRFDIDPYNWP